jgi:hypothetical protein
MDGHEPSGGAPRAVPTATTPPADQPGGHRVDRRGRAVQMLLSTGGPIFAAETRGKPARQHANAIAPLCSAGPLPWLLPEVADGAQRRAGHVNRLFRSIETPVTTWLESRRRRTWCTRSDRSTHHAPRRRGHPGHRDYQGGQGHPAALPDQDFPPARLDRGALVRPERQLRGGAAPQRSTPPSPSPSDEYSQGNHVDCSPLGPGSIPRESMPRRECGPSPTYTQVINGCGTAVPRPAYRGAGRGTAVPAKVSLRTPSHHVPPLPGRPTAGLLELEERCLVLLVIAMAGRSTRLARPSGRSVG